MTPWNGEQQRLLRAMGYVLYARTSAPEPTPAALPMANSVEAATTGLSRLLSSLQLAAMGRDVSALIADLTTLRGNARAKRALWPKLRALRRSH
jgi:hypothetical protein